MAKRSLRSTAARAGDWLSQVIRGASTSDRACPSHDDVVDKPLSPTGLRIIATVSFVLACSLTVGCLAMAESSKYKDADGNRRVAASCYRHVTNCFNEIAKQCDGGYRVLSQAPGKADQFLVTAVCDKDS